MSVAVAQSSTIISPSRPSTVRTLVRNGLVFGGIGALVGAGLSLTSLPVLGAATAGIAAAVGGAVGIGIGVVKGLIDLRRSNQASDGVAQITPPLLPPGRGGATPVPTIGG